MKPTLLSLALLLSSCATQADGTKTFAGLTGKQWLGVGVDAGSSYLEAKQHVTSGKEAPATVEPDLPWYFRIIGL